MQRLSNSSCSLTAMPWDPPTRPGPANGTRSPPTGQREQDNGTTGQRERDNGTTGTGQRDNGTASTEPILWPLIVELPIDGMVIFHTYVSHYQRVPEGSRDLPCLLGMAWTSHSSEGSKPHLLNAGSCRERTDLKWKIRRIPTVQYLICMYTIIYIHMICIHIHLDV